MRKFNLTTYIKQRLHESFRNQEEIDSILDKINQFGYDGISRAEKRRLKRLTADDPENVELLPNERPIEDRAELVANSSMGRYIPMFVCSHKLREEGWDWSGVNPQDLATIKEGPDGEFYWEAWDDIMNDLKITINGEPYQLVQNEDLWAVPMDIEPDEFEEWLI